MEGVRQAFIHAFRIVFLCSIPFGVVGTIAACLTEDVNQLMTNVIEMRLYEGVKLRGEPDTGGGHIITIEEQERHKHHQQPSGRLISVMRHTISTCYLLTSTQQNFQQVRNDTFMAIGISEQNK
jgi:hypothetical protein